jgi:CheY-like chemotaxis protein
MVEPYVLVVDDEALLRESLVRWLKSLGYRSVAVDSADEYQALLRAAKAAE